MFDNVLKEYGLTNARIEETGSGLINHTWTVTVPGKQYILQRINTNIFHHPEHIAANIRSIGDYLQKLAPDYLFVRPLPALNGEEMIRLEGTGCFRLFPFVKGSHTIGAVQTPEQAYEAAAQFGKFTCLLSRFDAQKLTTTIPDFHNLSLRYQQFLAAVAAGNKLRIGETQEIIKRTKNHSHLVTVFERIKQSAEFRRRVTHHDTKISNVLFNEAGKAMCVIDLDTVMPGYFISDAGDMLRTYLSPVSEEESDVSKIVVREEFYKAIVEGYSQEMKSELTETEKKYFFYAGQFMIYMQALRFLTDYLNNDIYYGAKYPKQNLVRATNQLVLLDGLVSKKDILERVVF